MHKNYDYVLKFVLMGSSSVGKSSILKRFADDQFEQNYISTIGIDFRFKSLFLSDSYIKLQIWDTAGQERFRGITKSYYKGANAIILVFDLQNPRSFEDVISFWIKQIRNNADHDRIFCFANKYDSEDYGLTQQQTQFFIDHNIEVFLVSAKTGVNITESILEIAKRLILTMPKATQKESVGVRATKTLPAKKKCCN